MRTKNDYDISEKLYEALRKYLSLGICKTFHDLTSFLPDNKVQNFFDRLQALYDKNPNIFEALGKNLVSRNRNLSIILLLCTVYKDPNIFSFEEELKNVPHYTKKYYEGIKSHFDECSFFVPQDRYEKQISGAEFVGRPSGREKVTEFVLSRWASREVVKVLINSRAGWEAQQSAYVKLLGYPEGYLDNCSSNALYQVIIDGNAICNDKELLKEYNTKMHFPNGDEAGINEYWIAGGVTHGGIFEMVIDNLPNSPRYIKKVSKFPFVGSGESKCIEGPYDVSHVYYKGE